MAAAELVQRDGQNADFPRQRCQIAPVCVYGKAFKDRAVSCLQFCARHDVAGRIVGGCRGAIRHPGSGLSRGFLCQGGHLGVERLGADRHRRRGLRQNRAHGHEEQHRQRYPQAAEPLCAVARLQLGRGSQKCQRRKTQQQTMYQKCDEDGQEHSGDLLLILQL